MNKKSSIWIDMQAPPDVQFFKPFINNFSKRNEIFITARDYAETIDLLNRFGIEHSIVGSEKSGKHLVKIYNTITRSIELASKVSDYDVTFSLGNLHNIYASKLRNKVSINFMDNELGLKEVDEGRSLVELGVIKSQTLLSNYIFAPSVFPCDALVADGMNEECIRKFDGYKEDIYIADYKPNPNILEELPFNDFVVVRPESYAIYKEKASSLVPELLNSLVHENFNVVYLPRLSSDLSMIKDIENIFVPKKALDGLDLCYFAHAVLTGSGTLAREAACMGTPSVSFFPNDKLLAVDSDMVKKKWMLHSRDVNKIIDYVTTSKKITEIYNLERSRKVQSSVFEDVQNIIESVIA